jgi:hypothetical protein
MKVLEEGQQCTSHIDRKIWFYLPMQGVILEFSSLWITRIQSVLEVYPL